MAAGELEVRGPWIAGAYYGGAQGEPLRPEDKFSPDGWLRTGDVGTITPNGYLTLTDRAKDVIKSGGEWISSVELENHLMAHPHVAEAAVVAVPDDKWGERPLATVVLTQGATIGYEELKAFLGERIARWQLPERWAVIPVVPKTSVGKFDKKVLRRQYAEGELDVTLLGVSRRPGGAPAGWAPGRSGVCAYGAGRWAVRGSPGHFRSPWSGPAARGQFVPILASRSTIRACTSVLVERSARKSTVSPAASRGSCAGSMSAEV